MEKSNEKANKKGRKVAKIIITTVCVLILLLAIFVMVQVVTARMKGKVPSVFGYSFHVVETASMEPEIKVGDLVIAKKVDKKDISVDDDIVFISQIGVTKGAAIVHRVTKINEDGTFATDGINPELNTQKENVSYDDVVGEAVATSKFFGVIFGFAMDHTNIIFIVLVVIIGLIIVSEVVNMVRVAKQGTNNEEVDAKKQAEMELREELKQELLSEIDKDATKDVAEQKDGDMKSDSDKDLKDKD